MKRVKAWLKKWWWLLLLCCAALVGAIWVIISLGKKKKPEPVISFAAKAREKITEAKTEATIERLKVKVKADKKRKAIEVIEKIQDDFERRKKLADFLDDNL